MYRILWEKAIAVIIMLVVVNFFNEALMKKQNWWRKALERSYSQAFAIFGYLFYIIMTRTASLPFMQK